MADSSAGEIRDRSLQNSSTKDVLSRIGKQLLTRKKNLDSQQRQFDHWRYLHRTGFQLYSQINQLIQPRLEHFFQNLTLSGTTRLCQGKS